MSAREKLEQGILEKVTLLELSKLYAAFVLSEFGNNKVHAAKALKVDRRTLQRWKVGPEHNLVG